MGHLHILGQSAVLLQGTVDLHGQTLKVGGLSLLGHLIQGFSNGVQLMVPGQPTPMERLPTLAVHGIPDG
jgi:hypothetical protein